MSSSTLPSFLQTLPLPEQLNISTYLNAQFIHPNSLGPSHALWWPPRDSGAPLDLVILFLPGNPGLADFYIPFLDNIFNHLVPRTNVAILAHSHLDHSPKVSHASTSYLPEESLTVQVQASLDVLEAVHTHGKGAKVIVMGHSVGSWISLEVFKRAEDKVSALFLLTPTISNIGSTPNGRRLSKIFSPPLRSVLGALSPLAHYIPRSVFRTMFSAWPVDQLSVLREFVCSSRAVLASLCMAHEEMKTINDPDFKFLQKHIHNLYFYYAENDNWVGEEKGNIINELDPNGQSPNIVRGPSEIPHAFCINANHYDIVAEQCNKWISSILTA